MKIEYWYNGREFELKVWKLKKDEIDEIVEFCEELKNKEEEK